MSSLPHFAQRILADGIPSWFEGGHDNSHVSFSANHANVERGNSLSFLFRVNGIDSMGGSTIFALSTVPGKSAVAVVRISGPQSQRILQTLTARPLGPPRRRRRKQGGRGQREGEREDRDEEPLVDRQARLRRIHHPITRLPLDRALTLFFRAPGTFTGEDVVELHLHGGRAVIASVLEAIPRCDDGSGTTRFADPGEFSRRAFRAGKMDLTQAEGLVDLIDAETEEQRRSAFRQSVGGLRLLYEGWRETLVGARGQLEAVIDFGEDLEDGVEAPIFREVIAGVRDLRGKVEAHLRDSVRGELLRTGIRVAIFGPPNAGKSSLLNILAKREASIVSPEAGTTRDVVESVLDIGGFPVLVGDTAGLRTGIDVGMVEQEGVRRARARIKEAEIRICMIPANSVDVDETTMHEIQGYLTTETDRHSVMLLLNKSDLNHAAFSLSSRQELARKSGVLLENIHEISCTTRAGMSDMMSFLVEKLRSLTSDSDGERKGQLSIATNERHREQVRKCLEHLETFLSTCKSCCRKSEYCRSNRDRRGAGV